MTTERNVTKRVIQKSLPVPYKEGDEDREELVQAVIDNTKLVSAYEAEMEPLKAARKEAQESVTGACSQLVSGKYEEVDVEQTIDYDDNRLTETRLDTNEVIYTRELTADDYNGDLFDKPEE